MSEPYNAGDPTQVNEAKKKSARRDKLKSGYVKATMGFPEGRAWVWDLLTVCGVFSNPMSDSSENTAFKCGMQNVGQQILAAVMGECPDLYLVMQKEANDG